MSALIAFARGVIEFRDLVTSSPDNIDWYDWGREIAHRVTGRRYEP